MGSEPIGAVLARAIQSFGDLTSLPIESVSRVERADDGWQVSFEVVELERIPHLTDLLASYDVDVDPTGKLLSWRRIRRYTRKQQDEA